MKRLKLINPLHYWKITSMLCLPEKKYLTAVLKYVNEDSKKEIIQFYQITEQGFCEALTSSEESSRLLGIVLKGLWNTNCKFIIILQYL